jgi:cyclophilin family peptidyl-prolyl cis-trans isomerase
MLKWRGRRLEWPPPAAARLGSAGDPPITPFEENGSGGPSEMLRLFTRPRRNRPAVAVKVSASRSKPLVEELEGRAMFAVAPFVTGIITDNRGEVTLNTSRSLNPATITTASVFLFSVGTDGIPLTADDIKMPIRPTYTESNRQLRIRTIGLPAGTTFFVKLSAKQIMAFDGVKLDGEFNGPGVRTGNGVGGGDLLFVSKRDRSTTPVTRFYTNYGGINVRLNKPDAPGTVDNFLHYANEAAWDGTFFHRSHSIGDNPANKIIQGGGFFVDRNGDIQEVHEEDPIVNEFGSSSVRGTISMAKSADPDSATNEWFFNVGNNGAILDDPQNSGGFTVFGNVADAGSLAVMDQIANLGKVSAGPFSELPVNAGTGNPVNPVTDLVSVRRVAILNKVSALV